MNTIIFGDTETTGIPDWKIPSGDKAQPHMASIAAIMVDADTRKTLQTIDLIIKPQGWVIPDETIEIHGITNEMANDIGVEEHYAVSLMMDLCRGRKRVFYNTTFDNRIIRIGTKRYMPPDIQDEWKNGEYECSMQLARKVIGGKNPKLEAAYKYFTGEDMPDIHTAMGDTMASMKVYFAAKDALG